jgi:L-ribulose-5-phosphate 3-epimerase
VAGEAVNTIAFMTANYVARETGYAMHGWGHGDRATNEHFSPLETYEQRFDELLGDIRALGFDAIDLWGAHLSPEWATDEHVVAARRALERNGLAVTTYATWIGPSNVERACVLVGAVGTTIIGGGFSGDVDAIVRVLRARGARLGIENHPEKTPAEVLAKIGDAGDVLGATVDTGWFATQGYDPARAIEELGAHVFHVHLKDVLAPGEHDTCRWGTGIVDIEACVRALQRIGYTGVLTVEHEPETFDPTDDIRAMRTMLEGWLR